MSKLFGRTLFFFNAETFGFSDFSFLSQSVFFVFLPFTFTKTLAFFEEASVLIFLDLLFQFIVVWSVGAILSNQFIDFSISVLKFLLLFRANFGALTFAIEPFFEFLLKFDLPFFFIGGSEFFAFQLSFVGFVLEKHLISLVHLCRWRIHLRVVVLAFAPKVYPTNKVKFLIQYGTVVHKRLIMCFDDFVILGYQNALIRCNCPNRIGVLVRIFARPLFFFLRHPKV